MKMQILAIWPHLLPVFGQLGHWLQCQKLVMSIFVLVMCKVTENRKKIPSNYELLDEDTDFDHFGPFLICFWPVLTPACS